MGFIKIFVFLYFCTTILYSSSYPQKCDGGDILKREIMVQSGVSSMISMNSRHYDECKFSISIKNNKYAYSYKNCWSDGTCQWIDSNWETLYDSNHGAFQTKCGYGGYFGTIPSSDGIYICWYKTDFSFVKENRHRYDRDRENKKNTDRKRYKTLPINQVVELGIINKRLNQFYEIKNFSKRITASIFSKGGQPIYSEFTINLYNKYMQKIDSCGGGGGRYGGDSDLTVSWEKAGQTCELPKGKVYIKFKSNFIVKTPVSIFITNGYDVDWRKLGK